MKTKERITVNPQDSITVNLKGSKDQLKNISVKVGIIVSLLTVLISWRVSVHTEQVEETKQLNNYLNNLNTIILDKGNGKQTILIDNRPSFGFSLQNIKEIDYLTRAYTRNLNPKSRRIVLIYLYESDLINHTKATGFEASGQEGICSIPGYRGKIKKDNILVDSNTFNIDTYPYCNLSTNRYYFDNVDMSGIFLANIKLHNSYLNRTNFTGAKLMGAEFRNSGFRGANFTRARLEKVNFSSPKSNDPTALNGANFTDAELQGAIFTDTNLSRFEEKYCILPNSCPVTNFTNSKLQGSKFIRANLSEANFTGADISEADFTGAENITPEQIKQAKNWEKAKYDPDFRKQLGLSPV